MRIFQLKPLKIFDWYRNLYILVFVYVNVGDIMTTIYDLLKDEKNKVKKLNNLRDELVEEKRLRDLDEADCWVNTDFKAKGLTNDKQRNAYVKKHMSTMPNTYSLKKAAFESLEQEIKWIRETISVMQKFGVEEIDFTEKDKDKESSSEFIGQPD